MHRVALGRLLLKQSDKPLVILAHHTEIDIIVPGNETPVAHGTDAGTPIEKVCQPMGAAKLVHSTQHVQLHHLELLQVFGGIGCHS